MRNPPPPVARALIWGRHFFATAALLLLGACGTTNGDFGEVRAHAGQRRHARLGRPLCHGCEVASKFELTDDERELRDLAYPLIDPPYDRQQWYSVAGEYRPLPAVTRPCVRPHRLCDVAALGRWPLAAGALFGEVGKCAPRGHDLLVAARTLAVGALCAPDGRCAQRHHPVAAILRNRHARARYRPEAAKKHGLGLRSVAGRTQKRRAAHARERVDRRLDARKTGAARSRPIVTRSSASSSRRRRRRRPTSSARSINCRRRSRATAPRRRPGCASRTWSRFADYFGSSACVHCAAAIAP